MNREHDAGREYAEIWGETVEANRKLRTLAMILGGASFIEDVPLQCSVYFRTRAYRWHKEVTHECFFCFPRPV